MGLMGYPLVNEVTLLWKDPPCEMGRLTISMVMFHSYVKVPEGTRWVCDMTNYDIYDMRIICID